MNTIHKKRDRRCVLIHLYGMVASILLVTVHCAWPNADNATNDRLKPATGPSQVRAFMILFCSASHPPNGELSGGTHNAANGVRGCYAPRALDRFVPVARFSAQGTNRASGAPRSATGTCALERRTLARTLGGLVRTSLSCGQLSFRPPR